MQRMMLDLVDSIHTEEFYEFSSEIQRVTGAVRRWIRDNFEPVDFEVEIAKIIFAIEEERKQKANHAERWADCDKYTRIQ